MQVDPELLDRFLSAVPARGRVLNVGCGTGEVLHGFLHLGFAAEGIDESESAVESAKLKGLPVVHRDFRLLTLKKESYDAIWCHQALNHLSIEECHRVLGFFFQALKPQTGVLFISFLEISVTDAPLEAPAMLTAGRPGIYRHPAPAFLSLLRQSGFTAFLHGQREGGDPGAPQNWYAVFARRSG